MKYLKRASGQCKGSMEPVLPEEQSFHYVEIKQYSKFSLVTHLLCLCEPPHRVETVANVATMKCLRREREYLRFSPISFNQPFPTSQEADTAFSSMLCCIVVVLQCLLQLFIPLLKLQVTNVIAIRVTHLHYRRQ